MRQRGVVRARVEEVINGKARLITVDIGRLHLKQRIYLSV